MLKYIRNSLALIAACIALPAMAQPVESIVGVVGDKIILRSEIEVELDQLRKQSEGQPLPPNIRCEILNQKMAEKLLLYKADVDSVVVDEDHVTTELERRLKYLIMTQFGTEKALEAYYGKNISEIKASNRDKVRDDLVISEMKQKIFKDVKVSPTDVKDYFKSIPDDSLPFYSAEVELAQIVRQPQVNRESKQLAYERISELRERIMKGEDFKTLAILYSDDHVSAARGGELGAFTRGDMVAEFETAAFKLKGDSVSKIIQTKFGYHILQLIERKGESINVRHILIRPVTMKSDLAEAKLLLDSLVKRMRADSLSFSDAAKKFSDDETKANGGFILDQRTGASRVDVEDLPKDVYMVVQKMKPGEISDPELIKLEDGSEAWRVLYLKSESEPHKANLRDDYQKFQAVAFDKKRADVMSKWINKYKGKFYIKVAEEFVDCPSMQMWLNKN